MSRLDDTQAADSPGPDRQWLILGSAGNLIGDYRTRADRDDVLAEYLAAGEPVSTSHWEAGGHSGPGWTEPQLRVTAAGRDWRSLRAAEARARDAGLAATVPQPDRYQAPGYAADAAAWGTGRGIAPDGPETGAEPEAGQ